MRPGDGHDRLRGVRVELVSTTDPYTDLKPGDYFDDAVDWDSGSGLGLIAGTDTYRIIEDFTAERVGDEGTSETP